MLLIFGLAEGLVQLTERFYREMYPQLDAPDHLMFSNLYHNLCKYRSLRGNTRSGGGLQVTPTPNFVLGFFRKVSNTFCAMHGTKCVGFHSMHGTKLVGYCRLFECAAYVCYRHCFIDILASV
ncbi:hypothetical protein TNCV_1861871 [Trichonephila clavipes]|nr:hypothetical protein TNCV_1861871 [Trichonephila clavipes]